MVAGPRLEPEPGSRVTHINKAISHRTGEETSYPGDGEPTQHRSTQEMVVWFVPLTICIAYFHARDHYYVDFRVKYIFLS